MQDLISKLRRIPPADLISRLSKISIEMFISGEYHKGFNIPIKKYGIRIDKKVALTAWDIHTIEYLSIRNSNDYRRANTPISIEEIIALYRKFDNDYSSKKIISDFNSDGVFRTIMGMTAEQFMFQNFAWILEKFNRDYHILVGATHLEHHAEIDTNDITQQVLGVSVNDYILILLLLFFLCKESPDPMNALVELKWSDDKGVLTKENILKLIRYYSCTYEDLRNSPIAQQLLYSKPFIITQIDKRYLSSSIFSVAMTLANGLYWLVRDYYRNLGGQQFPNAFGLLFEDYIKELATTYCKEDEWEVLPQRKSKGADFLFKFPSLYIIIETKSSLLQLSAKQQIPNLEAVQMFFDRTIEESYEQLESSFSRIRDVTAIPIIKVILLYDEFSNTGIIELSIPEIFENDPLCYIVTIREFEILLYLHLKDPQKFNLICQTIIEQCNVDSRDKKTIGAVLQNFSVLDNFHLKGEMDKFSHMLQNLITHLSPNSYV